MSNSTLFGIVVVPAVVGLVQVCKQAGLPSQLAPAAAVFFGILAALAELYQTSWPWTQAIVVGVALGLSASGLYSAGATLIPALSSKLTAQPPDHTNSAGAAIHPEAVGPPSSSTATSSTHPTKDQ
jgi:hypothetical protein